MSQEEDLNKLIREHEAKYPFVGRIREIPTDAAADVVEKSSSAGENILADSSPSRIERIFNALIRRRGNKGEENR